MKFSRLNALLARTSVWLRGKREPMEALRKAEDELPSAPMVEPVAPKISKAKPKVVPKAAEEPKAPACPHCKKVMVLKVARTGANAGGECRG